MFRITSGVTLTGGGKHAAMGTHNRVLKLGPGQYLEVIAIDPEGRQPDFPRWFNLDDPGFQARLKIRPRLITWVVRTDNVDALAEAIMGSGRAFGPCSGMGCDGALPSPTTDPCRVTA